MPERTRQENESVFQRPEEADCRKHSRAKMLLLSGLLALLVFVAFQPALNNGFVSWDDPAYVTANAQIQQGITWQNVKWALQHTVASNWHPITVLSHMLDCQLFGPNARYHHLTSLLLHVANSILLFLVFNLMTGALWRSFFVAALFGLHPLSVESVAWVAERKNVLSTLFFFLAIGSYVRYARSKVESRESRAETSRMAFDRRLSTLDYFLALFFFALGLMAKPMLVTLPFVLLLLDYWPLGRFKVQSPGFKAFGKLVAEKIPFFVITIAFCIITFIAQRSAGAVIAAAHLPLHFRIENALVSYVRYLGKSFWPGNLSYFYVFSTLSVVEVIIAVLLLTGISVVAWVMRGKMPYVLTGWLWFLGTLVPVIGLVQVGEQAMADRYAYVPLIGIYLLLIWGLHEWVRQRHFLVFAGVVALSICTGMTRQQTTCWKDSESLYRHAIAVDPGNWAAHGSLGRTLRVQGRLDEAIEEYQTAIGLFPDDPDIHNNFGTALIAKGRLDEAIVEFEKAIRLRPDIASAHVNLGTLYYQQGRLDDSIQEFQEALRLKPDDTSARHNLEIVLKQKNAPK